MAKTETVRRDEDNSLHPFWDVSVVVCTYNRAEYLRRTLESLVIQNCSGKFSYEILVVDNASTDCTKDVVEQVAGNSKVRVRYVIAEKPGLANARNKGVAESRGEWIVCFDDDQLAEPNWLYELLRVAWETGCHCVGGKRLLDLPEKEMIGLGLVARQILGEHDQGEWTRKCSGLIGDYPCDANVIRSRKLHEAVQKFSTSWPRGGQDEDYSRRVVAAGFAMWYAPESVVYHMVPQDRLTTQYFKWTSLRWGTHYADRDYNRCRRWGVFSVCLARVAQMLLVNIPYYFFSFFRGNQAEIFDRKCLIVRCVGYTRRCLFLLAPRMFPQERFFNTLDFRKARVG